MSADIFGYAASLLNMVMLIPQVWKTWKTKQTEDLSLVTLAMFLIACAFWTVYGLEKQALPVILSNTVVGTMNLILIFLKFRYK